MLSHQLLEEHEFRERCAYCGKEFLDAENPKIIHYGDKEYISLSCSAGHTHSFQVDITRVLDAKLLQKNIEKKKKVIIPNRKYAMLSIEEKV